MKADSKEIGFQVFIISVDRQRQFRRLASNFTLLPTECWGYGLEQHLRYRDCEPLEFRAGAMRILIAEDDALTLGLLTELVRKWNYETISVNNGDIAWENLCRDNEPVLLLADWQIPGLHGDELCRLARTRLTAKPVHIILTTATQLTVESKVRGFAAGGRGYFL